MDNIYLIVKTRTGVIYAGKQDKNDSTGTVLTNACRIFLDSRYTLSDVAAGRPIKATISSIVSSISIFGVEQILPITETRLRSIHEIAYCGPEKKFPANYNQLCLNNFRHYPVVNMGSLPIAVQYTHGRFAKGICIMEGFQYEEGYAITYLDYSAFDTTLHKAFDKIQNAILNYQDDANNLNDVVDFIVTNYPDVDALVPCLELVLLHNKLTHSCRLGIREFCEANNVDLHKEYSMRYFLTLVKNAYSTELINNVAERYGITI